MHAQCTYVTLHLDDVDEDGGEAVEGGAAPHRLEVGTQGGKQGQSHLQRTSVAILRGVEWRREWMAALSMGMGLGAHGLLDEATYIYQHSKWVSLYPEHAMLKVARCAVVHTQYETGAMPFYI